MVALRLPTLNFCAALWLLALLNASFWRALWHAVGGWDPSRAGFLLSLPVFALLWTWLLLEALTWGRAAKPVLGAVLVVSAALAYFMNAYGVVFDRTMVANIAETHPAEAIELVNLRLLAWLLAFGAVPAALLTRVRVVREKWHGALLRKGMTIGVLVSAAAVIVAPFFGSYAPLLRSHRELRLHLVPSNFVAATYSYTTSRFDRPEPLQQVALDARRPVVSASARPTLTLLVIGETARASNFALNGYARSTTPNLSAETDLVNFRQVSACGTSTAVSLPCMFLDVGRAGYRDALAVRRENLLDVLQHAGFIVLWRDNNSGCKHLCDRVTYDDVGAAAVPAFCNGDGCYDEVLLHGLQEKVDRFDRDAVVVLHMKGSHGPAYHLRYPAAFERFTPACNTSELGRCERTAVVNAYDNSLLYTDYVLARTIDFLRRNAARFDTTLVYVSDHGESLGERGLYLHGMPYAIAPPEQTHVPMLVWLPQEARARFGIDASCLRAHGDRPMSHDNLYHSMLGLLGVTAGVYRPERDLFRDCRGISRLARRIP